ncbi:MAG TPA: dTDP-4-dehydrorhamnose 3,5-epimerase [Gammaproteobacteria bacterium]|nr:dTDP-4-dehydrorhamnose 3,5-epimerase [Gammaproteobacteria bacterium]
MKIIHTPLNELLVIKPKVFKDDRGYFLESFQENRYQALGMPNFVQDNLSHSKKNVLRGLHYQSPHPQGKLIWVVHGIIWDIALDIRSHSPTFGQWYSIELHSENHIQLYVPPGFAHGFCVLSKFADVYYKCTDIYIPIHEHGIAWNDPCLNIPWPIKNPILSQKDKALPTLREMKEPQT